MRKSAIGLAVLLTLCSEVAFAQADIKWYKFDKGFISGTYPADSAFGFLRATASSPATQVHPVGCGGNDGELHVGVSASAILAPGGASVVSGPANTTEAFGVVVEPPNVTAGLSSRIHSVAGKKIVFFGYLRVWNEGHDSGPIFASNPHHVLELHPAWGVRSGNKRTLDPQLIFPMPAYHGYGPERYGPLFKSMQDDQWPKVAEDANFVFVGIPKEDNFYQLPVSIKQTRPVSQGLEATVDVNSDIGDTDVIFPDLTVVAAKGSEVATQLNPDQIAYLLGFFSVNLRKAMAAAAGHTGTDHAMFAPEALEFFTFGFPKLPPVATCSVH